MLTESQRTEILRFDTRKIANALGALKVRLHLGGFTRSGLHYVTGGDPVRPGYAVASQVKAAERPLNDSLHLDPFDWADRIAHEQAEQERTIIDLCRSNLFTASALAIAPGLMSGNA